MAGAPAFDPSQPFESAAPAFDPGKPFEPAESAPPTGGFWSSLPRGLVKGFAGAAGAGGSAEANSSALSPHDLDLAQAIPGGEAGTELVERNVTGALPRPGGRLGRFGETVGEALGNPASYVAPGGLLTKAAGAVAGGLGSEAAGQTFEGTRAEIPARIIGGLAGGVGGGALANVGRKAPSIASAVGDELAEKFGRGAIKPGTASAEFGIPLSTGEAAGDFNQVQFEQAAKNGAYGDKATKIAREFFDRRAAAAQEAVGKVGTNLDRFGQDLAESPIASAEMAGEGLNQAARIQKGVYKSAYDEFADLPGVIHAGALEGIGQKIKGQLTLGDNPVIIDDVTTPVASKAIRDIEQNIDRLKVQNRADPFGQPSQENIVGVNLKGIDQTRKRLVQFAADARTNPSDSRAMGAIIKAFDGHIEDAVAGGLFSGDDRALQVLKEARAGYANYQKVFKPQKNDGGVGAVIDKIVNRADGAGATAGEVANFLYGAAGTGATGLSARVAQRMRAILGPDSPEWAGIRQGMWRRLTQATEGKDAYGPQKISQRIFEFANGAGSATAQVMFSPQELSTMRRLASALKETVPPPGSVNTSGSAYTAASIIRNSANAMGSVVAHGVAGRVGGWLLHIGRGVLEDRADARKVSTALYGAPPVVPRRASGPPLISPGIALAGGQGQAGGPALPSPSADDQKRRQLAGYAQGGRVNPDNIASDPTEAQKEAGNYAKDHVRIHGLDLTIENAKGSERKGIGRGGKPWSVKMPAHYGYLKKTQGADGDHVDVYLGAHTSAPKVFVVDQVDADTGKFDEHKALLGFASKAQAVSTYHKGFSDGRAGERIGHVSEMSVDEFKRWLAHGDTTKPLRSGRKVAA